MAVLSKFLARAELCFSLLAAAVLCRLARCFLVPGITWYRQFSAGSTVHRATLTRVTSSRLERVTARCRTVMVFSPATLTAPAPSTN